MKDVKKLTENWVRERLPKRPKDANKGTFGKVLVIAGSEKFPGAAYLACAAAYRAGAGLVTLVTDRDTKIIVSRMLPELTFLSYTQFFKEFKNYDVLLLGPGLGQSEEIIKFVKKLLKENLPKLVADGDCLNILSKIDKWWEQIKTEIILTPHPGEMARLTNFSAEEIQKNRLNMAQKYADSWGATVVLKGANTIVASPGGEVMISPFANPLLSTAGTGDILAGVIAGFIAQDLNVFDASCCAVYIHGLAGEMLREKIGTTGALAGDLLPLLPMSIQHIQTLNQLN